MSRIGQDGRGYDEIEQGVFQQDLEVIRDFDPVQLDLPEVLHSKQPLGVSLVVFLYYLQRYVDTHQTHLDCIVELSLVTDRAGQLKPTHVQ